MVGVHDIWSSYTKKEKQYLRVTTGKGHNRQAAEYKEQI